MRISVGLSILLAVGCVTVEPDPVNPGDDLEDPLDTDEDPLDTDEDPPDTGEGPLGSTEAMLPSIKGLEADCEPPLVPAEIPLAAWMAAADDVIEGRIVSVHPAWTPLATKDGFLDDLSRCEHVYIGVDVVLADVVSRRGGAVPGDLTVRLGAGTFSWWGIYATSTPGSEEVMWAYGDAPLVDGMRIGGAVYTHVHVDHPVIMSGFREPLYEVVDGRAHFQVTEPWECEWPTPQVEDVDGVEVADLESMFTIAGSAGDTVLGAAYRDWLRVDDTGYSGSFAYSYASYCNKVAPESE